MSRLGALLLFATLAAVGVVVVYLRCRESSPAAPATAESVLVHVGSDAWPVSLLVPADGTPRYERVVLVTLDTLRADHVSAHGYRRRTTPFLDSLADQGVLFERAVASVTHTAPSHASLLTGLPPEVHGVLQNGHPLPPEAVDLAVLFEAAGYETAAFLNVKFMEPIARAFDHTGVHVKESANVVAAAIDWLRRGRTSERFFVWVHLYEPHRWRGLEKTPAEELEEIRAGTDLEDDAFYSYVAALHGLPDPPPGEPFELDWNPSIDRTQHLESEGRRGYLDFIDAYDARILRTDRLVERLYNAFASAGDALWILTADHGEGLASHGVAGHGSRLYQEQLQVPLVVHATDGSLGPLRVPVLVQHVDLLPTLSEVVGAEVRGLDSRRFGASLWPLLDGLDGWVERRAFAQRRPLAGTGGEGGEGVRAGGPRTGELYSLQDAGFKFLWHSGGLHEFYVLAEDPLELESRMSGPSAERDSMRVQLEEQLGLYRALRALRSGDEEAAELSAEVLQELRDLGYVE